MDEALKEFGIALGKLKTAFAEEYHCYPNYVDININSDNYVTLIDSRSTGGYIGVYREWVDIE